MFKALHRLTGEEINLLERKWLQKIRELRSLDHADHLVCQGCMQPVRVRLPRYRRAHFAHKHLANCAFGLVSPELLQARALLYEWLVTQFGTGEAGGAVTLEKIAGRSDEDGAATGLPRPVDGWVETEAGAEAYWIMDLRMSPEDRKRLQSWAASSGARVHWVFLGPMLHEDDETPWVT